MRELAKNLLNQLLDREAVAKSTPEEVLALHDTCSVLILGLLDQLEEKERQLEALMLKGSAYEAQINEMRLEINALKRKLNTNSTNSGIPPSRDPIGFDRSRGKSKSNEDGDGDGGNDGGSSPNASAKSGDDSKQSGKSGKSGKPRRKVGAKKGHKGHKQQLLKPDEVVKCAPGQCRCGCEEIEDLAYLYTHQYQEIPIIPLHVTHFELYQGHCSNCGRLLKGKVPPGYTTGYGPNFSAQAITLTTCGVSRRGVVTFFQDTMRTSHGEKPQLSQGGLNRICDRVSAAVEPHHEKIGEIARTVPVNNVDETSWRIFGPQGKSKNWLWIMISPVVAFIKIHENRSKEAFQELIGDWSGYLMSDDYALYRSWPAEMRQSCLAHLCRAAKKLSEDPDPDIAKGGTRLYRELCRLTKCDKETLTEGKWRALNMRLRTLLNQFKDRDDGLGRLTLRMDKIWPSLFTFLGVREVEPTNNRAERGLRPSVVKRKVSFGSTSTKGLRFVERMVSFTQTCKMHGWSVYEMLREIMSNFLQGLPQDLSKYDALMQSALDMRKRMGLATPEAVTP